MLSFCLYRLQYVLLHLRLLCLCLSPRQTSSRWKAKCGWSFMRQTIKRRHIHLFWYTDQWWVVFLPVLHIMKIKPIYSPNMPGSQFWRTTELGTPQTNKQTNKKLSAFNGRRKGTGMAKKTNACRRRKRLTGPLSCLCSHLYLCMPPIWRIYIRHEHTLTNASPRPKGTLNVDTVHLPLSLTTVLTPAHLIDCTKSELISLGGREPTHGYLCHSRIDLREGNLPWRV